MGIWQIIKKFGRRAPRRINGEASRSDGERAIIVRWGNTATLKREPLVRRERADNGDDGS